MRGLTSTYGYLLPMVVTERKTEPVVIKKANQIISFNFGNVQLFDVSYSFRGAANVHSLLKKKQEIKEERSLSIRMAQPAR